MTTTWIPNKVSIKDPSQNEFNCHSPFRGYLPDVGQSLVGRAIGECLLVPLVALETCCPCGIFPGKDSGLW